MSSGNHSPSELTTSESTGILGFPNPVNEGRRVVAAGATLMALAVAVLGWGWVLILSPTGSSHVLTGPTLSPLGRFATELALRISARRTHRTTQALRPGDQVVFSVSASILWLVGLPTAARVVVGLWPPPHSSNRHSGSAWAAGSSLC